MGNRQQIDVDYPAYHNGRFPYFLSFSYPCQKRSVYRLFDVSGFDCGGGNIIDCVFYGVVFSNPAPPALATMFPDGGGYGTLMHGLVVDMFYFPLCEWNWPDWMPWVGGEHFIFFRPVFNLADAAISVGMIALVLFYSRQISEVPWRKSSQLAADDAMHDNGKSS